MLQVERKLSELLPDLSRYRYKCKVLTDNKGCHHLHGQQGLVRQVFGWGKFSGSKPSGLLQNSQNTAFPFRRDKIFHRLTPVSDKLMEARFSAANYQPRFLFLFKNARLFGLPMRQVHIKLGNPHRSQVIQQRLRLPKSTNMPALGFEWISVYQHNKTTFYAPHIKT